MNQNQSWTGDTELERSVERIHRSLGNADPPLRTYTRNELDRAVARSGRQLSEDLYTLYESVGSGPLAYFEIVEPDDPHAITELYREDIEDARESGLLDGEASLAGDLPTDAAIPFAIVSSTLSFLFVIETAGPRTGRVIAHSAIPHKRMAWTAANNLDSFLRCIAELCEAEAFARDAQQDQPNVFYIGPEEWNPDRYRDILDRNNCTGAIYGLPDFD
ncbi:MAG: hypothetical protein AAF081_08690 [Actinomycetota bacterium]